MKEDKNGEKSEEKRGKGLGEVRGKDLYQGFAAGKEKITFFRSGTEIARSLFNKKSQVLIASS